MSGFRIACGSGGALAHLDQALEALADPGVQYASFDLCAERTLATAQATRMRDEGAGYWPKLAEDMTSILPLARSRRIRLIGSWGQANPRAGAEVVRDIARRLGYLDLKIATVLGDEVFELVRSLDPVVAERDAGVLSSYPGALVSAHAYLGAAPIVEALGAGADIVITGRCTDSALFLAPAIHEFGWSQSDWPLLGRGVIAGHLLECAVQVTGGNFADPPRRTVVGLDHLPHPLADIEPDGSAEIFKPSDSGGLVSELTCRKQLVHEIGDPAAYLTPDVSADFRQVRVEEVGKHRVRITGGSGSAPPPTSKVLAAKNQGTIGIGEASFAGPRAADRARLAASVITSRLERKLPDDVETRIDLIGLDSIFRSATPARRDEPGEVRLRYAVRSTSRDVIERLRDQVDYQWLCVSGVSGVRFDERPALAMYPVLIPTEMIYPQVVLETAQ